MISTDAMVFVGSFAAAALCVALLGKIAARLDLVDHPAGRKAHERSTPLIGGIALMIGGAAAVAIWLASHPESDGLLFNIWQHKGFFVGAIILAVVGVMDDRRPIAARYKFVIQLIACIIAVVVDHARVGDIGVTVGGVALSLGLLVWPFTILVMLTITNAMNMIDGVDGLAGGITFAATMLIAKAVVTAGFTSAPFILAFAGGMAGFLVYNFPWRPGHRAMAFLGDAGSMICGFTLAYLAIEYSALPTRVFKPSTALWFFFIPVADTVWLYLRRLVVAGAPTAAGRDHIHHLLMQRFTPGQTTWLLVGTSAAMMLAAYLAERRGIANWVMIVTWILSFLAYGALTQKAWMAAWRRGAACVERETAQA